MHWPRGQKVKGQGHTVTKTITVARLLVTMASMYSVHVYAAVRPAAVAGVGLHVDTTAYFLVIVSDVAKCGCHSAAFGRRSPC